MRSAGLLRELVRGLRGGPHVTAPGQDRFKAAIEDDGRTTVGRTRPAPVRTHPPVLHATPSEPSDEAAKSTAAKVQPAAPTHHTSQTAQPSSIWVRVASQAAGLMRSSAA